jgi:hypothetical protein
MTPQWAFAEARLSEEPGAGKPHAGIYAGRGRATALPTATVAQECGIRLGT